MKKQCLIIILIDLFLLTQEANIIPDPYNPISISIPSNENFGVKNTVIKLQFTLAPPRNALTGFMQDFSTGLYYHQYIGISIPGMRYSLKEDFRCEGAFYNKKNNNERIVLSFSEDLDVFKTIAYCRLEDFHYPILPGNKTELFITIIHNLLPLILKEVVPLSLFTSSTIQKSYVFDFIPVFGTFSIHPKFTSNSNILLSIEPSTIPLVIDTIVDFYVTIDFSKWFLFSDYTFAFNYQPRCFKIVESRTSVELLKGKADSDPIPPIGSFFLRDFTKSGEYDSIAAEFTHYGEAYNNQRFIIAYKGIGLVDTPEKSCEIEVVIYYKNTNSVISILKKDDFNIIGPIITLKAKDPDNSAKTNMNEYFASGAFPIQFIINSSLTLSNFYLLIQHANKTPESQITFVASTCDLTGLNKAIPSNLFATRPNCYPLFFENDESKLDDGSGFFVYIQGPLKANTEYYLTIWAFFDICKTGGTMYTNYFTEIEFEMSFYRTIDKTQIGKNRFVAQYLLSNSSSTGKDIICYNTYPGKLNSAARASYWDQLEDNKFYYKEYFEWSLHGWKEKDKLPITNNNNNVYFYSEPKNDNNHIFVEIKGPSSLKNIEYFPLALKLPSSILLSKIIFKFSESFVQKTSSEKCFITWIFEDNKDFNPTDCSDGSECNWIGTPNTISPTTNMGNQATIFKSEIISSADYSNRQFHFGEIKEITSSLTNPIFKLANNCHQFKVLDEKITSLYQPFQIIIGIFVGMDDTRRQYQKMMRLIKLLPEPGVFNKLSGVTQTNVFINHHSFIDNKKSSKAVCLLELTNDLFNPKTNIKFNTLTLWIYLGSLIETDYDKASQYPVSSLNENAKTYGLTSQNSLNALNYYSKIQSGINNSPINILKNQANPISAYHFFMGSVLIFNQVKSRTSTSTPILIPYYCPQLNIAHNEYLQYPTIIGGFMNSIEHSHWSLGVQEYLIVSNNIIFSSVNKKNTLNPLGFSSYNKVKFPSFIEEYKTIEVELSYDCNAHIMMFDKSLFENDNSIPVFPAGDFYYYKKIDGYLYPYGKQYKGFLFSKVLFSGTKAYTTWFTINKKSFATENNSLSSIDKVGFWCFDQNKQNKYSSNEKNNSMLASYTTKAGDWGFKNNKSIDNYQIIAGFAFTIQFPETILLIGAVLKFELSSIASVCGMTGKNKFSNDCTSPNNTHFTCKIIEEETLVNISCYNTGNNVAKNFELTLPNTPYNNDIDIQVYTSSNSISFSPTFPASDPMTLKQFVNDYSNHIKALGKMTFELDLQGNLLRDVFIRIDIDQLTDLILNNFQPKCILSFNSTYPFGNESEEGIEKVIFQSCEISGATNTIIITTNSLSYKHDFAFPSLVYIHLWPIIIIDLTNKNYKIEVNVITLNKVFSIPTQTFEVIEPLPNKNITEGDVEGKTATAVLTELTSLSINIPGEKSDYTFKFYLSNPEVQSLFEEQKMDLNEITIFFSHNDYSAFEEDILCYEDDNSTPPTTTLLHCSFSHEGVLNIQFPNPIQGTTKIITLSNIKNPHHLEGLSINYAYSLNSYDHNNNKKRFTLLYGTGTSTSTVKITNVNNAKGLHFHKLPLLKEPISDILLRTKADHRFRIGFDIASDYTSTPSPITDSQFIIEFPNDYQLFFPLIIPNITINEYYTDIPQKTPSANQPIQIKEIFMRGNRIFVIPKDSLVSAHSSAKEFLFWEILIKNITLPKDFSIENENHTGPYKIMLISNDRPINYYSTPSNSYSFSTNWKEKERDKFRHDQWYKGNKLSTDDNSNIKSKWYIDVISESTNNYINNLEIQPGRFYKARFIAKENQRGLDSITDISLIDAVFQTMDTKYTFITSIAEGTEFSIGCPCNTPLGSHYVHFEVMNKEDFEIMLFIRILLYVDTNKRAKIIYDKFEEMPIGSSQWVNHYIDEPNVDELKIKWTRDNFDFKTVTIPPKSITDKDKSFSTIIALFSFNNKLDYKMNFTAENPNSCYEFEKDYRWFLIWPKRTLIQEPIPKTFELLNSFMDFKDSVEQPLINKNSLQFLFTPPTRPSYLYCYIQCADLPIPTVDNLLIQEHEELQLKIKQDTFYKKYHSLYIPYAQTNPTAIPFVVNDLIRGMAYRLACAYESADAKWRKNVFGMMIGKTTNLITTLITPTPVLPSHCVTQQFTQNIDKKLKQQLVGLCQRYFTSTKGLENNGCVVCTDITQTMFNQGISLTRDTCLETTSNSMDDQEKLDQFNSLLFSTCALQDVRCPTDPEPSNFETQFSEFVKTIDTQASILRHYNLTNIPVDDSKGPIISSDEDIDAIKLFGVINSWNMNKELSFTVYYNGDNMLGCYYIIQFSEKSIPQFEEIQNCNANDAMCDGIILVSRTTNFMIRKIKNLPLDYNSKYAMYFGCRNISPKSKHSVVISLGSWVTDFQLLICPDGTTINYPACLSSNYIHLGIFLCLLISVIIL